MAADQQVSAYRYARSSGALIRACSHCTNTNRSCYTLILSKLFLLASRRYAETNFGRALYYIFKDTMAESKSQGDYDYLNHDIGSTNVTDMCLDESTSHEPPLADHPLRVRSAGSYSTVCFSVDSASPLHPCGPRTTTYQKMVENERKIRNSKTVRDAAARSYSIMNSNELYIKLFRFARQSNGVGDDEEKGK